MDIIKRRENKQKLSLLLYREPPETSGAKDKEKGRPLAQKERGKAPPPGAQRSVFSKTRVVFKKISHPCPAVTKKNAVFVVFTTELHGGPHSSAGAGPPPLCRGGNWLFFHPIRDFLIFWRYIFFVYRGFAAFLLSALSNQVFIGSTYSCYDAKKKTQKTTSSANHIAQNEKNT